MTEEIELEITESGGIRMLHNDAVNLSELGEIKVTRASHVEYCNGNVAGVSKGWYVQSAETLSYLKHGFKTRSEALAWEKEHYSPSGKGWAELTKEVH